VDLLRLQPQGPQRFVGRHERAEVTALAGILPGVEHGDRPVRVQLDIAAGLVGGVNAHVVHADREAHTAPLLRRRQSLAALAGRVVLGLGHLHELRQGEDVGHLARAHRIPSTKDIAIDELPRVEPAFLRQFVHQDIRRELGLG